MKKQINIDLPDFCENCEKFVLEQEEVHARDLDGNTIILPYYSCSNKDFCCYQYRRLTNGSSPNEV